MLWQDLKLIGEVIFSIILINVIVFGIFFALMGGTLETITNDINNTNKQYVDYDAYIHNTFNTNSNESAQTDIKKEDYITDVDIQEYKQSTDYIPGKANPFAN